MRRRIALGVPVAVFPGDQCLEGVENVAQGVGIGILVDEDAGRCVRQTRQTARPTIMYCEGVGTWASYSNNSNAP